jgi:hypothetical protein
MPLDEIVILLRWIAAILTVLVLFTGWAVNMLLNALERLSTQLACVIQQADETAVSTSAGLPDDSKLPEVAPWHDEQTLADLVARSE